MEEYCFIKCYVSTTPDCTYTVESTVIVVRGVLSGKGGGKTGRTCLDDVGNMFPKSKDGNDFSNEMMLKWEQEELSQNKLKLEIKRFLAAKVIGSIKALYNNNVDNTSSL